ncbi:hypothetical protein B0F90DRAFT_1762012, partial [Multifurca ochricompacta]
MPNIHPSMTKTLLQSLPRKEGIYEPFLSFCVPARAPFANLCPGDAESNKVKELTPTSSNPHSSFLHGFVDCLNSPHHYQPNVSLILSLAVTIARLFQVNERMTSLTTYLSSRLGNLFQTFFQPGAANFMMEGELSQYASILTCGEFHCLKNYTDNKHVQMHRLLGTIQGEF